MRAHAAAPPRLVAALDRLRACGCAVANGIEAPLSLAAESDSLWLTQSDRDLAPRRRSRHAAAPASPHRVDFDAIDRRVGSGHISLRKQPLGRALGASRRVLDATAGWGNDAALAALMGFEVVASERCAVVHAMLEDGLARARADPSLAAALGGRLRFERCGDSRALLSEAACAEQEKKKEQPDDAASHAAWRPDAVLIDPMWRGASGFTTARRKRSTALPRASIQLLAKLVGVGEGADADAAGGVCELTVAALERRGVARVVLKKPRSAPPLDIAELKGAAGTSVAGHADVVDAKLVRYEIIWPRTLPPPSSLRAGE